MRKKILLSWFLMLLLITGNSSILNAQNVAQNVAKVGNTEYAKIDEAIAAWTNGTTLTLLADVTLSDVVKINSNESRTLDLGTFTMTAASGKDAFQYVVTGSTSDVGLSIKADATNPGGINAPGKAIIRHTKPLSNAPAKDRPYTQFFGGVFNASYIVYQGGTFGAGYTGASAPRFVFHGGEFNGTIYANRSKFIFNGGTFNGNIQISVDSSANALVKGGKFKNLSNLFGSALNSGKFTIGSAAGVYDRGIYVDKDGYYVITSAPIKEVSAKYPAVKKESYNSNNYFYYSAAAANGMFYEVASMAGTGDNVTVFEPVTAPDVEEIVKPEATEEEKAVVEEVIAEVTNNAAVENYTVELPAEVTNFTIKLSNVEVAEGTTPEAPEAPVTVVTEISYTVTPLNAAGKVSNPSAAITFRLPVPAAWAGKANVYHEGTLLDAYTINKENDAKFVEVTSASFSEFSVEAIVPTEVEVATLAELQAALADNSNELPIIITETIVIPEGETVVLDLNGKTVTRQDEANQYALRNLGDLTIKDTKGNGSINARGIYNGYGDGSANVATAKITVLSGTFNAKGTTGGAAIFNYGVADIQGGNFTSIGGYSLNNQAGSTMTIATGVTANNGIYVSGATLVVNGGEINGNRSGCHVLYAWNSNVTIAGGTFHNNNSGNSTTMAGGTTKLTINGGTFSIANGKSTTGWTSCLIDATDGGKYEINGGEFKGHFRVQANCAMEINGGTFENTHGEAYAIYGTAVVKGGTFTDDTAKAFATNNLADGYEVDENGTVAAKPVAQVGEQTFYTFAEAAAAAQAGDEIKLLANIEGDITVPANVTLNGNGFAISGAITAEGKITFAGVTEATNFGVKYVNTVVNIPAGASLQLTGTGRMVIGHGCTFNITGTIEDAKNADKATLVPSLKIAAGASITGNSVTFNVNNAYIVANANTTSKNNNANGTLDFNIDNSIWDQTGVLAFYVPTSGMDPVVNFELKNSVLTTTSHLVFSVTKGEIVIDNSLVNQGTSRQIENRSTMTIKNGSVVNGAVATSSNAINPGTIIVENATYAVTGEFSGAAEGTGTIVYKKGATISAGSITKANIQIDATGMANGDVINLNANLTNLAGTLEVINNDKLEAKIVDGKIVLAAKPVAKIGEQGYATLYDAVKVAKVGDKITLLNDADLAFTDNPMYNNIYASEIDLNGKTLTIKEGDLRFDNVTIKNGNIIVQPGTYNGTAIFLMYSKNLTFDAVKVTATGVAAPAYLIGLEGTSNLNLLNGSEIVINNESLVNIGSIIADNGNGNTVTIEDSKIEITNSNARLYLGGTNGNITVENSDIDLNGVKEGFYLRAGQTLAITGTSTVDITLITNEGRYGINLTDITATYTKAETATVNATLKEITPAAVIGTQKFASLQAAIEAVQEGETVTVLEDITFTTGANGSTNGISYTRGASFTLDLNGKTITSNLGNNALRFKIGDGSAVTGTEVTVLIKNGKIVSGSNNWCAISAATADNSGNKLILNLTDLTIEANKAGDFAVKSWAGAVVNANNVDITTNYAGGFYAYGGEMVIDENCSVAQKGLHTSTYMSYAFGVGNGTGKMTINGGTYTAAPAAADDAYNQGASHGSGLGGVMSSGGTLIINGGTFTNDNFGDAAPTAPRALLYADAGAKIEIKGGTFNAMAKIVDPTNNAGGANAEVTISGGTFSANPTDAPYNLVKLAEGYVAVENNDGVWNVVKAAAKIGEKAYATFADALDAVQAGETLTLLADLNMSEILVLDKAITFDGNDKTLTSSAGRAINVSDANGVTIKNLTINASGERAINVIQNATNVTIDGVTATAANYTVNVAASAPNAVVAISNSTLNGLCTVNVAAAGADVTIDNSTVNCNDNNTTVGESYAALSLNKDAVGASIVATNTTVNVAAGSDSMKGRNSAENGTVSINGSTDDVTVMVAVITYEGSAYYYSFETLAEAVEFAKAGETVALLRDVTVAEKITIAKSITLDGNGKTLTYTGNGASARAIDVPAADGVELEVTIKNLTVDCTSSYCQRGINYNEDGKLTLEGVTVKGTNVTYALNLPGSSDNAVVTINNSSLTGNIALNVWGENSTINAENTTFTAVDNNTVEGYAAVKLNNDGTTSAEGSVITITGGKIDVTGSACTDTEATSNGTSTGKINISSSTVVNGMNAEMVAVIRYADGNSYSFMTIEAAIAKAQAGETVTLLRDITASEIITINKAITLDGNGKKLTSTAGRAINVSGADGVTIKNLTIDCSGERAINVIQNATNVTIENVTATAANYTVNLASSAGAAKVAISGSNLTGLNVVNVGAPGSEITIDGGTITCNDENANENYAALALNKDAVGAKIAATGVTFDIKGDSKKAKNGAEGGVITIDGSTDGVDVNVAYIKPESDYYYAYTSIEAAIEAANAGQTIVLIRDVTVAEKITIAKSITFDGNDKTLTYTGEGTSARAIDVPAADGVKLEVTIKNLTVDCTSSYCQRGINYNEDGKLTLEGVTVKGTNVTYALNLPGSSDNAEVTINNSSLTGNIALNIWGADSQITATNSVFTSVDNNTAEGYAAISLNNDGAGNAATGSVVTIDGGKIIAKDENGNPSTAVRVETVATVNVSEETEVVGSIKRDVAIVTYEGSTDFYSFDNLKSAINKAANDANATVKLISNIELSELVEVKGKVVIDLNGKKVTSTAQKAFAVLADATIKNGTIEAAQRCVDTRTAVVLTLTDVTLIADEYTTHGNPQPLTIGGSDNGTEVTMDNVEINAGTAGYGIITFVETELTATESTIGGYNALYVKPGSDNSTFNFVDSDLSGSTLSNDVEGNSFSTIAVRANNVAVNVDAESTVTANGNYSFAISFISKGSENTTTGSSVTVAGGITGNILDDDLNGNTVKVKAEYADELAAVGYATIEAENGLVSVIKAVAKIGETLYASLQEAIDAATNDATIVLIESIEQADGVLIEDKNITIDLNDLEFTVTEGASTNNRNFKITGSSVVTIKNGTMVAAGNYSSGAYGTVRTEGTAKVTLTGLKLYNYRGNGLNIKALGGTTVEIDDTEIYSQYGGGIEAAGGTIEIAETVKVEQKGMYTAPYNSMAVSVNGDGTVTINGGTFSTECITAEEAYNQGTSHGPWVVGVLSSGGTLIINGGTFSNDNYGDNSLATAARGAVLADAKANVQIKGGTFNALDKIIDIQNNIGGVANNPVVTLEGGTYSADPTNGNISNCIVLAQGYELKQLDNGYFTVIQVATTLTRELAAGWSWFSSYVDTDLDGLKASLEGDGTREVRGKVGNRIMHTKYNGASWGGTLNTFLPEQMYMIESSQVHTMEYYGEFIEDAEIVLYKGWNWIAYPLHTEMTLKDALADFTPADGDVIKNKEGNESIYYSLYSKWYPEMTLVPGEGYMYYSNNTVASSFVYSTVVTTPASRSSVANVEKHWSVDTHKYPFNMTMTAVFEDAMINNYEIAAFVNGECRGSARPTYIAELDTYLLFLAIHGEKVENVTFTLYDIDTDTEYELSNSINYTNDAIFGSIDNPYVFSRGTTGIGETAMSNVNIYPNPTTTGTEINLEATCDKVEVFNALGVKLAEYQNVDSIDALDTAGIYVIRITNNGNVQNCRLVVK